MAKSKTVVLYGREDLLGRGVEFFLASRKDWEVIRITDKHDPDFIIREMNKANPDVIIIYQGDCAIQSRLPAQLIWDHPGLKVITVSLESNLVEVYNKQKVLLREVGDLLSIVES